MWTVEWVLGSGQKELGVCPEFDTVSDAYNAHTQKRRSEEKSRHIQEKIPKKRKRRESENIAPNTKSSIGTEAKLPMPVSKAIENGSSARSEAPNEAKKQSSLDVSVHTFRKHPLDPNSEPRSSQASDCYVNGVGVRASGEENDTAHAKAEKTGSEHPTESQDPGLQEPSKQSMFFYLHAPRLPSPQPVLIPLSSSSILADCLRNRLVLEFPTIYVLEQSSNELSDGYITEGDFDKKMQHANSRERVMAQLTGNEEGEIEQSTNREDKIDSNKLAQVLQQDASWFQGKN